jgi:iron(III) transport system permease protein
MALEGTRMTAAHSRHLSPLILLFGGLLLVLVALVVYPSVALIQNSLTVSGRFGFDNYLYLFERRGGAVVWNTLVVALATTVCATSLGVLLAWLIGRVDVPLKAVWRVLLIVPYLIPPFIGAIAWVYLLSPVGYINRFWMDITGTRAPLFVIYGQAGTILVMTLYSYPIAYLVMLGPMRQISSALEEAARISGASALRVLRDITLPLLLPNIAAAALLIFMAAIANFGIPAVIGFPARFFTLTNEIYIVILNFDLPNNLQIAAAMSMQLVLLSIVPLLLLQYVGTGRSASIVTGKSDQALLLDLGRWKYAAAAFLALISFAAVIAPLLAILATSITPAPGVRLSAANATLAHYETLFFGIPKVPRAFFNSLLLAFSAASLVAVLAVVIAWVTVRTRLPGRRLLEVLVMTPYALPGTVTALAFILAFIRPVLGISLYNTIWLLLLAYVASFLAFGLRAVTGALSNIDPALEEAARSAGASPLRAFRDVVIPLVRASIAAGWFLAFMPALTELTLSALLFSVGNETIGQVVFGLYQEGRFNLTAALAFSVTIGVLLLSIVLSRLTRGRILI